MSTPPARPKCRADCNVASVPPTEEQIQIVKTHAEDPDALLPVAYLCTGERKGEMCALQLRDIDFDKMIIHITKSVEYQGNAPVLRDYTKTPAGIRKIPLLQLFARALRRTDNIPKAPISSALDANQ